MSLAEIEAAIERLPAPQQEELFVFLAQRVNREKKASSSSVESDPMAEIIGAFAGATEATGRRAEDILYGRGA